MHARTTAAIAALACVWLGTATLVAHHGTNISYDRSKQFTAKAVVTDFKYVNPHVQLFFDVTDDKGKVRHWSGELLPNPAMLLRNGWTRKRSVEALKYGLDRHRHGRAGSCRRRHRARATGRKRERRRSAQSRTGAASAGSRSGALTIPFRGAIMTSRAVLSGFGIAVCAIFSVPFLAAQPRGPEAFVALGGRGARRRRAPARRQDDRGGRLRRGRVHERRRQHLRVAGRAAEVGAAFRTTRRRIDLEHGRMRVRQRNHQNFVFAGLAGYLGGAEPGGRVLSTATWLTTWRRTAGRYAPASRRREPAVSTC